MFTSRENLRIETMRCYMCAIGLGFNEHFQLNFCLEFPQQAGGHVTPMELSGDVSLRFNDGICRSMTRRRIL